MLFRRALALAAMLVGTAAIAVSCTDAGGEAVAVEFRADEVAAALDVSGLVFETTDERAQAIATFRTICVDTPENSINEFSVYDMLTHPGDYPAGFAETAEIGCPQKFATARSKIASGDCFGGLVSECDD